MRNRPVMLSTPRPYSRTHNFSKGPCNCQGPAPIEIPARRSRRRALLELGALCAVVFGFTSDASRATPTTKRIVLLPIELLKADYFPDPHVVTPEERKRLHLIAAMIRTRLANEGYEVVSEEATDDAVSAANPLQYLHDCNGCERDIARGLEADWVMVGWVQLVSNLIVNLNVLALDVESGARIGQAFVDLRGNNERSWRRATLYMLDEMLVSRLAARR